MSFDVHRSGKFEGRIASLDIALRRSLLLAAHKLVFRIVAEHEKARPATIATGQTMRSVAISPVYAGNDSDGQFLAVRVGPRTAYAFYGVEFGRSAGTPPPLRRIYQWVKEKPGGGGMDERELWAIAKAAQKTIAQTGTPAYFILSKAADYEIAGIVAYIRSSATAALNGNG